MHYELRVASGLNLPWYVSIEWNMEENFSMEWNMEWKKIARMEYGKIVFHSIPCPGKKNIAFIFLYLTSHDLF